MILLDETRPLISPQGSTLPGNTICSIQPSAFSVIYNTRGEYTACHRFWTQGVKYATTLSSWREILRGGRQVGMCESSGVVMVLEKGQATIKPIFLQSVGDQREMMWECGAARGKPLYQLGSWSELERSEWAGSPTILDHWLYNVIAWASVQELFPGDILTLGLSDNSPLQIIQL